MAINLVCTIESESPYHLGNPVTVQGTLHNKGDVSVWVLAWNTFLERIRADFAEVTFGGDVLPYDGVLVSRGHPTKDGYIMIPAGGSVSGAVDLTLAYPIKQPGDYQVLFRLRILDAFEEGQGISPQPPNARRPLEVSSAPTTIVVAGGGEPRPTTGERARAQSEEEPRGVSSPESAPGASPRVPKINPSNSQYAKEIYPAHTWSYDSISNSISYLGKMSPDDSNYDYWFGEYDAGRAETVLDNFNTMSGFMVGTQITYDLTDPYDECTSSFLSQVLAYTFFGSSTVYLCSCLFSWQYSEADIAQTFIHEICHAAAYTEDNAYGEWSCAWLAWTNPAQAIDNADSYAYFAMDVDPGPQPSSDGVWTQNKSFSDSTNQRPTVAADTLAGSLMFAYQDKNSRNWLWYRVWNVAQNKWGSSSTVYNPDTKQKCITSVGPAHATIGGVYYLLYVDGDNNSPTQGELVYITTTDSGEHWSTPQVAVPSPSTSASPALAAFIDGNLYAAYVDSAGNLNVVQGKPEASGVTWTTPSVIRGGVTSEPALGVFNGTLYSMYTLADTVVRYTTTQDGSTWSSEVWLPDSKSSAAPAIVQWNTTAAPLLMCVYRGVEPDRNLRYVMFNGTDWTLESREANNASSAGPALASYGTTLYEFNKGSSHSNVYWSNTTSTPSSALRRERLLSLAT